MACIPFTHANLPQALSSLDKTLQDELATRNGPGIAAVVVKDGQIVYERTYGVLEFGQPTPLDRNSVFRIASISKTFAGALILKLVEDGLVHLDAPVARYIPNFQLKGQGGHVPTVRHVLCHATGLPPYACDDYLEAYEPYDKLLERLQETELATTPGTAYAYQNTAYNLLEKVVESGTHLSYAQALQKYLFTPLGMANTSVGLDPFFAAKNRTTPHNKPHKKHHGTAPLKSSYYNAPTAGGINSTIADMAIWLSANLGNAPDVLSPQLLASMRTPHVTTAKDLARWRKASKAHGRKFRQVCYGLGMRIADFNGHLLVYHPGYLRGYPTMMAFMPDENIGLVLLAHWDANCIRKATAAFFADYLNESTP